MSENVNKPTWSLGRWLLHGTVFVLFVPPLFVLGAISVFYGIFSLFDGVSALLLLCVLGCGLLFAVEYWQRWFFRQIEADRCPQSFITCLLPVFIPIWYVLVVGTAFFFFAFNRGILAVALVLHFIVLNPVPIYWGAVHLIVGALSVACLIALIVGFELIKHMRGVSGQARGISTLLFITAALAIVCATGHRQYRINVLKQDKDTQSVRDEKNAVYDPKLTRYRDSTNLSAYVPFSPTNKLVVIDAPGLSITNDPPRLHGALGLYPLYAAATQAIYPTNTLAKSYSWRLEWKLVNSGTSPEAFRTLLDGKCDMTFMLTPSEKQFAKAQEKGKTLEVTKIGREAFVFFVSQMNPVDNLTSAQIRDIYGKRITNWSAVGGKDERILPFQRPEGSGSQTVMERFMGNARLARPVREEFQQGHDIIGNRVADYRNYGNAIGFSFRYYVEGMFKHDGVKLLAVDGVMPTAENIRSGAYPLVADVVIVTAGSTNPNVKKLTDWFLSPKGQELLENVGYVPLQGEL